MFDRLLKAAWNAALIGLGISFAFLLCGPMFVGAFDAGCWFLFGQQCTSVVWSVERIYWALAPLILLVVALMFAGA